MIYALDTNAISNFLRGEGYVVEHFTEEIIQQPINSYVIPPMVYFEIKRWLYDNPTKVTKAYNEEFDALFHPILAKATAFIDVWEMAAKIYIALKHKGQLIGDVDILIASYCMINDYTLVTRNINDFIRIDGLKFVNWFE